MVAELLTYFVLLSVVTTLLVLVPGIVRTRVWLSLPLGLGAALVAGAGLFLLVGDLSAAEFLAIFGAVGVSGGLLPCPSALVVLLAAISLHRVAFGLVLIVAFSLGLALTITGIGLVAVFAKRAFGRMSMDGGVIRLLPAVSALVILVAGALMTARAIPKIT